MTRLPQEAIAGLDRATDQALVTGDESKLRILGYGEISTVVAWSCQGRDLACKRLPLFDDEKRLRSYVSSVDSYLERLRQGGIRPLETTVNTHRRDDGRFAAYCVQPILQPGSLLPGLLARSREPEAGALFGRVLEGARGCVTPRLGLDGQASNWALVEGELLYLDITTPMMRDEAGRDLLDADLFLASLPWALRGLVRRFMLAGILGKYYQLRSVVVDLLGNLYKERSERHLPSLIRRANELVQPQITEQEVRRYYLADARMWVFLQRLRRLDRWWQRRVRRRSYPFLLPGRTERHV